MSDTWVTVIEADSPEEMEANASSLERSDLGVYPKGTRLKIEAKIPGYAPGGIFDLAGAEHFSSYLAPHGCDVTDVRHEGGTLGFGGTVVVYCEVDFVFSTAFVAAVGLSVLALSFVIGAVAILIHGDDILPDALDPGAWGDAALKYIPIGLIGLGGIYLATNGGNKNGITNSK